MTRIAPRVPTETLRNAIADALASAVKAGDLPGVCVRLGLRTGDGDEAFRSKRVYVRQRLMDYKSPQLLELARAVLEEFDEPELADFLSELTTHAEHRITDLTRRAVLKVLDDTTPLFGELSIFEGLGVLAPKWEQGDFLSTLRQDVQQHCVDNDDYPNSYLLERCGTLTCSQQRFFDLIEKVLDPVCRRGDEQAALAALLNAILVADGFTLVVTGAVSRHPVYTTKRISAGVAGAPKNLIFAAINAKPDLYLTDAINNDVAIRNASDALIYDRFLPDTGLAWVDMVTWWQEHQTVADPVEAQKALYRRLVQSVKTAKSPGEFALFDTYYREFAGRLSEQLPALIPQVYLHYDPRTRIQRGDQQVLARQRMDLLLLLNHGVRVVIEVDGRHHYADDNGASPAKYAAMAAEDRRLRLAGYEIYRFGGAEFSDTDMDGDRFAVGAASRSVAVMFFERLFERHSLHTKKDRSADVASQGVVVGLDRAATANPE